MKANDLRLMVVLIPLVACSGKSRPFADGPAGNDGTGGSPGSRGDASVATPAPPESSTIDPRAVQGGPMETGSIQPAGAASNPAPSSCEADGGSCSSTVEPGDGSGCVPTGPRDCTSALDNDCDGRSDNAVDDVCRCTPGSVEPCEEHPGLDGRGQCRPGSRTCIVDEGSLTSSWAACEGSVGPAEQDSCAFVGDDGDCDGTNNGGCPASTATCNPVGPTPTTESARAGFKRAAMAGSVNASARHSQ
jgi:hypothetical protein